MNKNVIFILLALVFVFALFNGFKAKKSVTQNNDIAASTTRAVTEEEQLYFKNIATCTPTKVEANGTVYQIYGFTDGNCHFSSGMMDCNIPSDKLEEYSNGLTNNNTQVNDLTAKYCGLKM